MKEFITGFAVVTAILLLLFFASILVSCTTAPKSIYPLVNNEVLRPDWYICEFGVLQYRGGHLKVLDIKGQAIPCERISLTREEYCKAQKPLGMECK